MGHIIGIDLGTTNSTLAFSSQEKGEIAQFAIDQRLSDTLQGKQLSLPSFYLFPLAEEAPIVGIYAKERGSELPERVIASAKSWLCHEMIDRRSAFLPIGECEKKESPIHVCAAFLKHLRNVWESEFPDRPFREESILVTVPASFDPVARSLVLEAAKLAGFPDVRLMEEPLAAFYSWLYNQRENWRDFLKVNDSVLVIDIGGGTTDFSLISVENAAGDLSLERKAIGNHLLLGGDNIDLTLAHLVQEKFATPLDDWQQKSLIHACRQAKELLLGESAAETTTITIQGKGSRLIGGSQTVSLSKEEVEKTLVDGFFPEVELNASLLQEKRLAVAKLGLPYVRDPRITVQLAHFLSQSNAPLPTAVLFNGGTMKAAAFQKRVLSLLSFWKKEEIRNLEGADLDFAVSRGAVYYEWARTNNGIRVKAATCQSYFIGVEGAEPAVPGKAPSLKKVRLVPFGMEEGSESVLDDQFSLYLDEPVFFRFFSQHLPTNDELTELPPIETTLHAQGEEGKVVLVKLVAKVTELGILELWCRADDGRKWKLEFNIRGS